MSVIDINNLSFAYEKEKILGLGLGIPGNVDKISSVVHF